MVLLALSFQGQVEKYGVYVGVAAFFGLAVLSLLYFSQARELKRLREWAGRAPERARELEERVVAEAEAAAAASRPAAAQASAGIAPPRRLAEMPAPPVAAQAAGGGGGAQATELAEAVQADEAAEPATNGNVPAASVGTAAEDVGNGAAPAAEAETSAADAAEVSADGEEAAKAAPVEGDAAKPDGEEAATAAPVEGDAAKPHGEEAATAAPAKGNAPAAVAAGEAAADTAPAEPADAGATGAAAEHEPAAPAADETGERDRTVADRGATPPVPRITPAQRVGVTPRPAPMPLRQGQPSATPAGRATAPRRPGAPPARRPTAAAEAPRQGRSAGTIALFVGIAVLILGGGTFVISQLGDDSPTQPNRAAPAPGETSTGTDGSSGSATTPAETNVAVLNGTTFTGLAGQLADRVAQQGGYERGATETNTRDQTLQGSTVYYAEGFRSQARKVAELLSISAVEAIDDDTQSLAPEADVVVLAGADQAP